MLKNNLRKSFTDKDGNFYPNILEYHFEKGENLNLGRLIASSHDKDTDEYGEGVGFYVFQDLDNPNIGYRVYREFNNSYACDEQSNVPFIQKLISLQDNVQLTEFPYGIITLDNRVIGQIMPFYPNSITLREYVKENEFEQEELYLQCLYALKELCANGIYYNDLNADNFLVVESSIKIIDFEEHQLMFDKPFSQKQDDVLRNFKMMLFIITKGKIKEKYSDFMNANSFEELEKMFKNSKQK